MATKSIARRRRTIYVKRAGRRAKHMTIPLAVLAGFTPIALDVLELPLKNPGDIANWKEGANRLVMGFTSYDPRTKTFGHFDYLAKGLGLVLLGMAAHKVANKMGVNRMLASTGIPLVRI